MKKTIIVIISLIGFILTMALIAPFFVDLNKYKGAVKAIIEERINGTFDFESIELSIIGGLGANISGVVIKNSEKFNDLDFFKVNDVKLRISILSGFSDVDIIVESPRIKILKNSEGKLNVVDLLKKSVAIEEKTNESTSEDLEPVDKKEPSTTEKKVLAAIKKVKMHVKVIDAYFLYSDKLTKSDNEFKNINFLLKDLNLGNEFEFEYKITSIISSKTMKIDGDILGSGKILFDLKDSVPQLAINFKTDLSSLLINIPDKLYKTKGGEFVLDTFLKLDDYKLKFTNELNFKIDRLLGEKFNDLVNVKIRLNSNLNNDYSPSYSDFSLKFFSKKSDLDFRVKVVGDNNIEYKIESDYFNLDSFIKPPETILKSMNENNSQKAQNVVSAKISEKQEVPDEDPLKDIRNDPYLLGVVLNGDIRMTRVVAMRTEINNFLSTMSFKNLKMFATCTLNIFRGNINFGEFIVNFRTQKPLMSIAGNILSISLESVLHSIVGIKEAGKGRFSGEVDFKAAGITPEDFKSSVKGFVKLNGNDVKIKSFNVLSAVKDNIKKYPVLEKVDLSTYDFDEGIDKMILDLELGNSSVFVKDFKCYREKQYILAMAGKSTFDMILDLNGDLSLISPLSTNVLKSKNLRRVLLNRRGEIVLPFYFRGPAANLEYGIDAERTEKLYSKKSKKVVVDVVKEKLKKDKVPEKIINKIPKDHQDKAKKMLKDFGF